MDDDSSRGQQTGQSNFGTEQDHQGINFRVGLKQQYPNPKDQEATRNTTVDVVALHGLRAESPKTWIAWKDGKSAASGEVNWLRDPEMLPSVIPNARILTYDWNANYVGNDASQDRLLGHANVFLDRLLANNIPDAPPRRPLVFVASCFGGLLLAKALVRAVEGAHPRSEDFNQILARTAGVVFLGTPFRGSWKEGYYLAKYRYDEQRKKGLACSPELIQYLRTDGRTDADGGPSPLDDIVHRFAEMVKDRNLKIVCFYETLATRFGPHLKDLPSNKLSIDQSGSDIVTFPCLPYVSARQTYTGEQVVPEKAACLDGVEKYGLPVRHNLLHKHASPESEPFKAIANRIKDLVAQALKLTPLQVADAYIRQKCYDEQSLKIERLMGDTLAMEQCYINLAIIWQAQDKRLRSKDRSADSVPPTSPFSLSARLKIETPNSSAQIQLPSLFDPRKNPDGQTKAPRRILIRGRAGVGKTTLCKKIVHEFYSNKMWDALFSRVLWLPLRRLKKLSGERYNLGEVFQLVFFAQSFNAQKLSKDLWHGIDMESYRKTLFILDGVDEVSEMLDKDHPGHGLLQVLFDVPNVIVTTRPHVTIPPVFKEPDMELETIGFLPDQVQAYLEKVVDPESGVAQEIKRFLQKHQLIQGLVRIPIQLDAICSFWDDIRHAEIPETMAGVYRAIVERLWKKDVARLGKLPQHASWTQAHLTEIESYTMPERNVVESLAFSGMYNDVVELLPQHRRDILRLAPLLPNGGLLDDRLGTVSFLRTSDASAKSSQRSYHFLHLTFQEFFAAQYITRQWQENHDLEYFDFKTGKRGKMSPAVFLQQHKYTARYDVMWRFTVGLLDDAGKREFFAKIQQEPLDLLGPTHQRLVMHCLTEVGKQWEDRTQVETRLADWLLYECDLAGTASLATESEYPDTSLKIALDKGSYKQRHIILSSFNNQSRYLSAAAVEAIIRLLNDEEDDFREAVAEALVNQSNLSAAAVEAIIRFLSDTDSDVRWAAAKALGNQSNLSDVAVEAIISLLSDEEEYDVRCAAIDALREQSDFSAVAVEAITKLLNDKDYYFREQVAKALGNKSNLSAAVVKAIIGLLNDEDDYVQEAAAEALGKQSNLSATAVETIIGLLKNEDSGVPFTAASALGEKSNLSAAVVEVIIGLFNDKNSDIRHAAIYALRNQSNLSAAAVEAIIRFLSDTDSDVRWAAAKALRKQSNLLAAAVEATIRLLSDKEYNVQRAAINTLRNQSNLSAAAIEAIIRLFSDKDSDVRRAAAKALGNQSNLSAAVEEAIIRLLSDKDRSVRWAAAEALEKQSNLSAAAVEAIIRLLSDKDSDVRWNATRDIGDSPALIYKFFSTAGALRSLETSQSSTLSRADNNGEGRPPPLNGLGIPPVRDGLLFLFGSLICRAFREELCLYSDDKHVTYSIRQVAEANERVQLPAGIEESRQLWNPDKYDLW